MILHSVDFIGGDFDVGAFSTVGDGLSDPEFAAPSNSLLCCLGGLDDTCRECTSFIIMPRHPHTWIVYSHGCYKFDNADVGFRPRDLTAHFPAFLHLRVTNLPGPDRIVRSDQAQQRQTPLQATSATIRIEHSDLVDPAQCHADRRDSARCQYRPCGKRSCTVFVVAAHRLDAQAPCSSAWPKLLSLCLSAGTGRAGQSPRRDSQALCLTSSGLCP